MIDLSIISIKTVYLDVLKNSELKNYYLLNYLQEIVKFNYPFAQNINCWLKKEMNFKYKKTQEFNMFFKKLEKNEIDIIFKTFPEIYPLKLIFLMDKNNKEINRPSFTELIYIDDEKRLIDLILFNRIKKKVKY
jgi:hypothetical protein